MSTNRRALRIANSCQLFRPPETRKALYERAFNSYKLKIYPHDLAKSLGVQAKVSDRFRFSEDPRKYELGLR
jgi:hypothetical protein